MKRQNIVQDLKAFKEPNVCDNYVKIKMEGEAGQDFNGVFRDTLTEFYGKLLSLYFDGEDQASPVVSIDLKADDWEAIGSIFYKGYQQVGYFPLKFSRVLVICAILGRHHITQSSLKSCFLLSGRLCEDFVQRVP